MSSIYSIAIGFLGLSLLAASPLITPSSSYHITDDFGSIVISGTSNLHDWQSYVTDVTGHLVAEFTDNGEFDISSCEVSMAAASIESKRGSSIMDKKTVNALNGDSYPNITFSLLNWELNKTLHKEFEGEATGNLKIAGQSRKVSFTVKGKTAINGKLEIDGTYTLLMSDYGIDAPTALMGTLKTGDEVVITFHVQLENNNSKSELR